LLLLTDLLWVKGGLRANRLLYGFLALAGSVAGVYVWRILTSGNSAGLYVPGFTPATYFFTQCRVVWTYVRLLVLPFGQNADPDIAVSGSFLAHGAVVGFVAAAALLAAAWIFRKRWPLGSFGVFVFFLLLAPTSSIVPIADPMAERRVYLPFLGFAFVCLEFLRRLELRRRIAIEVPVLLALLVLTYQRSAVWGDTMALWQDTAAKSPRKVRPRSQLAYAYYEKKDCPQASANYAIAAQLAPPDYPLLIDWAYALDCAGHPREAIDKLQQATTREFDPQAWALMGMVYGKQHRFNEALNALDEAQRRNGAYVMTYAVRGNVYEAMENYTDAIQQYQRALDLDPSNDAVRQALAHARRQGR
jgi:protein O-mannosyl-transferase